MITQEQEQQLQKHIEAISKILYENTPTEKLETLGGIEEAVREQMLGHVLPKVGIFLSSRVQEQKKEEKERSKASLERLV